MIMQCILVVMLMIQMCAWAKEPMVEVSTKQSDAAVIADTPKTVVSPEHKEEVKKQPRKKRRRKEKVQSAESKKTLSHMNFLELKKSKDELTKSGNTTTAIKYLEKMVPLCNDLNELRVIMLEYANLLYETGSFDKASKMYNEFTVLYPGSDEVEEAMYRAVLCTFQLTLDAEHDQTKTLETCELAKTFLDRESFTNFKNDVETILSKCEERLFESEMNIYKFYMGRGNYVSATKRLSGIKEIYLNKTIPDIQMRVAALEADLTAATLKPDEAKPVIVAQNKEKTFTDRF
jgi:outer membrane assembly lipoprotein YfiO